MIITILLALLGINQPKVVTTKIAQVQTCVWPHVCVAPVAQVQTCVWPHTCSKSV